MILLVSGCDSTPTTPTPLQEDAVMPLPTAPPSLSERIEILYNGTDGARLAVLRVLGIERTDSELAIQAIISNLSYNNSEIRETAAWSLGKIGPSAKSAVPQLGEIMINDTWSGARAEAAESLGLIGCNSAIPYLAMALEDKDQYNVAINAAKSIARITGEVFPDLYSRGYSLDKDGVPFIVKAAQEWWQNEGQFAEWEDC
jgi:HEAT repeat protein